MSWRVPLQFRRALRRPQPAERDYLAAQYTGTGVQVGGRAAAGGWQVLPLAGSAAEHGGILPGERLLEISESLHPSASNMAIPETGGLPLSGAFLMHFTPPFLLNPGVRPREQPLVHQVIAKCSIRTLA